MSLRNRLPLACIHEISHNCREKSDLLSSRKLFVVRGRSKMEITIFYSKVTDVAVITQWDKGDWVAVLMSTGLVVKNSMRQSHAPPKCLGNALISRTSWPFCCCNNTLKHLWLILILKQIVEKQPRAMWRGFHSNYNKMLLSDLAVPKSLQLVLPRHPHHHHVFGVTPSQIFWEKCFLITDFFF